MSKVKPEDQGKALVAEIKASQKAKKALAKEPFTNKVREAVSFVKILAATIFALSIFITGVMAAYYGHFRIDIWFWSYAVQVAGVFTLLDGMYLLYWALMKVGK